MPSPQLLSLEEIDAPGLSGSPTASAQAAAKDRSALRRVQLRRKAVLALAILGLLGLAAVVEPRMTNLAGLEAFRTLGLTAIFAAIIGRAWCSLYIGGRKTHEIVDQGPYSLCRNPLYVFSILAAFGIGAQTGSLTLALACSLITLIVLWRTVLREEAWLRDAFGEPYIAYLSTTPRFAPRWSNWRDQPVLQINPARFVRTLLDGAVMLAAVPILAALAEARADGWIATLIALP